MLAYLEYQHVYHRGRICALHGVPSRHNPYDRVTHTEYHLAWQSGWGDGNRLSLKTVAQQALNPQLT